MDGMLWNAMFVVRRWREKGYSTWTIQANFVWPA
eukprot:SAG11_NODE_49916_length_116_cov_15.705882_1_plen_33_part_01